MSYNGTMLLPGSYTDFLSLSWVALTEPCSAEVTSDPQTLESWGEGSGPLVQGRWSEAGGALRTHMPHNTTRTCRVGG